MTVQPFPPLFGHFKIDERVCSDPAFTEAVVNNFPEIADILYGGIVVAVPFRFQPEQVVTDKIVVQLF